MVNPRPEKPTRTRPPADGVPVVLYDGRCAFCTAQARRLARLAGDRLVLRSFHDDGVLEDYPGVSREACMAEMKLVDAAGSVFGGAEAVVRAAAGHAVLGKLLHIYYFPGMRGLADAVYRWVAKRRYRLSTAPDPDCGDEPCQRHRR